MNRNSITNGHLQRCHKLWILDSCRVTMATLPIQQQWWQMIPANGKQLPLVPLNNTYPMNYLNQNYHKLFNLGQTQWDDSTRLNYGMSKMQSTTHQLMENNMDRRTCASIIWPPELYSSSTLLFLPIIPLQTYI